MRPRRAWSAWISSKPVALESSFALVGVRRPAHSVAKREQGLSDALELPRADLQGARFSPRRKMRPFETADARVIACPLSAIARFTVTRSCARQIRIWRAHE